jgi:hypothetical protein
VPPSYKPGQDGRARRPNTIPIGLPDTRRPGGNTYPGRQPFTDAYGQPIEIWIDVNKGNAARRRGRGNAEVQAQVGGPGTIIPVHYGLARIGARIGAVAVHDGALVLLCVWGEGEIDAVEQLLVNDEAAPGGVTVTHYLGTAGQAADPTLVAALAAQSIVYTDALPNLAYSVVVVPPKKNAGFPQVSARIRGRKVRATEAGTPAYSRVPAYILADFITNTRYGLGAQVNWADVATLATRNTAMIGSPAEARHELSVSIDQLATAEQWLATLADYAGAIVAKDGETYRLFPDAPGSSVATLTEGDIVEGGLRWEQRAPRDAPTVVEVVYTDTAAKPWADAQAYAYAPGADTGATERRFTRVNRPGIQRYSEAYRYAVQLLNGFQTSDITLRLDLFDEALKFLPGDVVTVDATPFTSKLFRVVGLAARGRRLWSATLAEYDAAKWSDVVVSGPSTPDTGLPSPLNVPAVTGFAVTEDVYQIQTGRFASRLVFAWTGPTRASYIYLEGFTLAVTDENGTVRAYELPFDAVEFATEALPENLNYTCELRARSEFAVGSASVLLITNGGKLARPSNVPSIAGYSVNGETRLTWVSAVDLDLTAHEIRWGATGGSWETAALLERVATPALGYSTLMVPEGLWRFWIKGLDSVRTDAYPYGQESVTAAYVDIDVVPSNTSSSTDYTPAGVTLSNMLVFPPGGWITGFNEIWSSLFPNAMSTYGNPVATYHGAGTSSLVSDSVDVGVSQLCQVTTTLAYSNLSGTAQPYIEHKVLVGDAWTRVNGQVATVTARYFRVGIETTAANAAMIVSALGVVRVSVDATQSFVQDTTLNDAMTWLM